MVAQAVQIQSVEELDELKESIQAKQNEIPHEITVCIGVACESAGSLEIQDEIEKLVKDSGCAGKCRVKSVGCKGLCAQGPLIEVDETMYKEVKTEHAKALVDSVEGSEITELKLDKSIPFFTKQKRIATENAGVIDPEEIEDYLARDGYQGLVEAVTESNPGEVLEQVKTSGLRGRGGGGYPTGLKWSTVQKAIGDKKYVVCNADEGDPGAFMDRSIMESDPHRVLEGMALAAYAVGASAGFLYIRAEYPTAVKRIKKAIKQAERYGLLGEKICGTPFSLHLEVRLGAGAFVCGEETALLNSIMGNRGTPIPRPPFPAEKGLWGRPTLINNVETYANVPPIIRNGGAWYAEIGTEKSKGTKVFALTGKIVNSGMIEVPMGTTLREIIYDIGGGIQGGGEFKAVQTGGPSGGCIPTEHLDLGVEYESLRSVGSMMGSGGMIVMDENSQMVDVAKFFMEFCKSESCGKCVPCRVGTTQMYNLLNKIVKGEATNRDLRMLEELCEVVRDTSLCGLGMSAPNPVLSTLKFFRHEYEELIKGDGCVVMPTQHNTAAKEQA